MSKIKVLVTDDHQLFRNGLSGLLKKYDFIEVLEGFEDGDDLLESLKNSKAIHPDIVLLDLSMPKLDGFEVLKVLRVDYPEIKAIAISMHDDGNYIAKTAQFGAYGYLLKNTDEKELISAIRQVNDGFKYYPPELSQKMIESMSVVGSVRKLTKKETEILSLLSKGFTTKEIAEKLYISTRTVETHRSNMLKKLEVKNTVELINKASELGLL